MPHIKDITGNVYGSLTVIKFDYIKNHRTYWICKCVCGNHRSVYLRNIKRQFTTCYCKRMKSRYRESVAKTKEYYVWLHIKSRCYNENDKGYKNYGARGIIVCDEWLKSFSRFLLDMGIAPSKTHSVDRIDNSGNYQPDNCRWATATEQQNNTRRNKLIEYNNQIKTLPNWCRDLNLSYATVRHRLFVGWSVDDAFSYPISYQSQRLL